MTTGAAVVTGTAFSEAFFRLREPFLERAATAHATTSWTRAAPTLHHQKAGIDPRPTARWSSAARRILMVLINRRGRRSETLLAHRLDAVADLDTGSKQDRAARANDDACFTTTFGPTDRWRRRRFR